jgi:toxin CptA
MSDGVTLLAAALLAGLMGFAIQRGSTCTVAAVDEALNKRRLRRLASLAEAAAWVAGGLLVAQALGLLGRVPGGYALGPLSVLGGALLGLGAWVNGACVFGAVARLGSGEWAFVATPAGFYLGCLGAGYVLPAAAPVALAASAPILHAPQWIVWAVVALAAWRLGRLLRDARAARLSPHAATALIGVAFLFLFLFAGAWAYTDVLAELARGMTARLVERGALLAALLAGALLGGWTAGRLRWERLEPAQLARCLAGGALMGAGTLLIPGGNDALVLVGVPLLWPYAWVALAAMCLAISAALLAQRALARAAAGRRVTPAD